MNAERLLAYYEKIADAPDAIARLRRFILDLAVRGKLVPQDGGDEPSSEMLKRIAKDKLDQAALPQGWWRAEIGSILNFQYGKGLKASERLHEGPVPVFGSNGIVGFTDEPLTDRPAIIVGRKGSAGALNLCDGPSWTTDVAYFVEAPSFIDLRFMLNALAAVDLDKLGKGVKPGLSRSEAYDQIIAIPPLAEQHRIVAKVDKLMGLCDRLQAARAGREAVRDQLAAASLARLNAPDPETFAADARFALDALSALTTRPDQIKALRQTILNLAVCGKLVSQDAGDEPASELLKRIANERTRAQALKTGRRNVEARDSGLRSDKPLPVGWLWTNIDEIALSMRYGTSTKCEYTETGVPVLRIPNVSAGVVSLADMKCGPLTDGEVRDLALNAGDLLMIRSNGSLDIVGRSAVVTPEAQGMAFAGYLVRLRLNLANIMSEYIWLALNSTDVRDQIQRPIRSAVGLKNVNLTEFGALTFPLPPLAEQHRIVKRVDGLMALCDRLESSLTAAAASRRRLLDALLAEALAPPDGRELQAAE